jgi:hypothetical protein
MRVFAIRIELPHDMSVQGAQRSEKKDANQTALASPIAIQIKTCRNSAGFTWSRLYRTMQQTSAA